MDGYSLNLYQLTAIAGAAILGCLVVFQCLLALGVPCGRAAWGGKHRVLPPRLRWASVAAVPILGMAAWAVLARASLLGPGPEPTLVRFSVWFFGAYFLLNTVGNLASKSMLERKVMTPVSTVLAFCFLVVALS